MTRFVRTAVAGVAVALAVSATETQAQIGFSIGAGPSFLTGDAGEGFDMGYHAQLGASFSLPLLPIGLQADGMFTRFDVSDVDDANFQILSGTLNAVINLPTPGITPYLIGGVGFYNGKISFGDESESETDLGANVGGGVRIALPGIGGIFAEARLHNVFSEGESTRFVPVTVGIRL